MSRLVDGEESRPCNDIYITRKPRPVGGELHFLFDRGYGFSYINKCAGVVKLVDARDSKSREPKAHVGSIPTSGTNIL